MKNQYYLAFGIIALLLLAGGCAKQPEKNTGIANPASVYCEEHGGESVIVTMDAGGQKGYCKFANGNMCEEWAFFRGECKDTEK